MENSKRTEWLAYDLTKVPRDEPLLLSLMKYRLRSDRRRARVPQANLNASLTDTGAHLPIIDLDFPHEYVPSSTPGHAHLYLNVAIPRWRWWILMWGLRMGRVIEKGTFVWSLRRGANFVRKGGIVKDASGESPSHSYGWLFPRRR